MNNIKTISPFVILFIIVFGLFYFIKETRTQIHINADFQEKINKARFINKNVDLILVKQNNFYNFDFVNQEIDTLDELVNEIEHHKAYKPIIRKKELEKVMENIKVSIRDKKELVGKFKSYNAIFHNSYNYLSNLYKKILDGTMENNKEMEILVTDVYTDLMKSHLKDDVDKRKLIENIKRIKFAQYELKKNQDLIGNFALHAEKVLEYNEKLNYLFKENSDLHIDYKFEKFLDISLSYFDTMVDTFVATTLLLLVLVIIFIAVVVNMHYKQVTARKELSRFKEAVKSSDNSVMITDKHFLITYANAAFENNTGYSEEEVLGKTPRVFSSGLHSQEFYDEMLSQIKSGKKWSGEFTNRRKDGKLVYENTTITPILDDEGNIENYIGIKVNVTDKKKYIQEIKSKSAELSYRYYNDTVTKLPNYNKLLEDLHKNNIGIFIVINIDNFNELKFFYGIEFTTNLLIQFARLMESITEDRENFFTYKLERDEFCIWIDDISHLNKIDEILQYIHERIINNNFTIDENTINITATLGASHYYYGENTNINDLLVHGDLAHRYAKSNKLPFAVFNNTQSTEAQYKNNLIWNRKIRKAIDEDRITVFFQPLVDQDGKIISYETLIRLIDENGNIVAPYDFLQIAKKSSLYLELTKIVINKAFDRFEDVDIGFSINISYEDIINPEIKRVLVERLKTFHKPSNFSVEVLESESIENYEIIQGFIEDIKQFGSHIAIDDFGSGFSNYERVVKLNVDYIKIDGSIIKNILTDDSMKKVAQSICYFANSINVKIVAEYISSQEIYDEAKKIGVDIYQGFLFSEPQPDLKS